jgi:hypothetical protein
MGTITIGDRSFETPILVPSVSSFETQLKPLDALRLQYTMREPISLVSAYDVALDPANLIPLCKTFRGHGVLLLDSGGYETQRIARYAPDNQHARWDFDKYTQLTSEDIYDLIFSFDYFLNEKEPVSEFSNRIVHEFRAHAEILDITKLIPVIHIQTLDGKRSLGTDADAVANLFATVAREIRCLFVAVPERELGIGLPARANLTKRIVSAISQSAKDCHLHILGCGNLLSFSALAIAGVTMCDGLEWCRTLTADNFHLHHFQQKDLFVDNDYYKGNPVAEFIVESGKPNYASTVAVRNLLSFQKFTQSLQARLGQHTVEAFIRDLFGDRAGDAIKALAS